MAHPSRLLRSQKPAAVLAVILAVIQPEFGGDGWESNPPRTPQQRPANGFEDRGSVIRQRPATSAQAEESRARIHSRSLTVARVRQVGCQFGCHGTSASSDVRSRPCPGRVPVSRRFLQCRPVPVSSGVASSTAGVPQRRQDHPVGPSPAHSLDLALKNSHLRAHC